MIIRDNFCHFFTKTYVVTPHHGSDEGSQHIFSIRNKKNYPSIIIKYSSRALELLANSADPDHIAP